MRRDDAHCAASACVARVFQIKAFNLKLVLEGYAFGKELILMANEEIKEEMETEGTLITLEDEEGNEVEFEFLDIVEHEGEEYIVLIENDEDADEVVILKINPIDEETEEYVSIDDDALLDTVFEKFKKKYEGDINFA